MPEPYLSLIIPTRNDDYPAGGRARLNQCLCILMRQLEEAKLDTEIIIVEYNPEPAAKHLYELLTADAGPHVTTRVITVEAKYHQRFECWEKRPFHQTCAINIGLRRARGRFAAYRAADNIYSASLVRFLGARELLDNCIYRCDRLDIAQAAMERLAEADPGEITGICESAIVEWYKPIDVPAHYHIPTLHTNGCGDFLMMSRKLWSKVRGLREGKRPVFLDYDSLVLHAAVRAGGKQVILPGECRVYKIDHGIKFVSRSEQDWPPAWKRLDRATNDHRTLNTWLRILFNFPRRRDRTFEGVQLDSFERHYLLPAFLWGHGFPIVWQNGRGWGLGGEDLPERVLARGEWDNGCGGGGIADDPQTDATAFPP